MDTISSSPWLRLTNNNSRHDLLSEFGLTLLDSGHDHVTDTGSRETVKSGTKALNGNDAQVSGTRVVTAVDDSADGETELYILLISSFYIRDIGFYFFGID